MSSTAQRLLTAEEPWLLLGSEHKELVGGEVVETMPPGKEHGTLAPAIGAFLRLWARQGVGGQAGVESGFILAHDHDTVRGPDVYYVSAGRIPSDNKTNTFWTIAPNLAVEVVSPSETADVIGEKVRDFLVAGTLMV